MNPFIIITIAGIFCLILERLFPRKKLPNVEGWVGRAVLFNCIQLVVILISSQTIEKWLGGRSLFKLPWSPFYNGIFAYLLQTWVFYWWHFVRHENNFLWLFVHQFHHSPVRIETITSFYKHPSEYVLNTIIIAVLTQPILGLDKKTNEWLVIFSALAEFFYHINISTPYWVGFIIQRPEMHIIHHQRDKQYVYNHGDIAIWDWLNATLWNPKGEDFEDFETGFSDDRELEVVPMLCGQNVLTERQKKLPKNLFKCMVITVLFCLGILNLFGVILDSPTMKGIAIVSTASPLPFVFSAYNGIETFSTKLDMDIIFENNTQINVPIDHKLYGGLKGPYNRRNVIGAIFSHGPFFKDEKLIRIKEQVLDWSFCKGFLLDEFNINAKIKKATINVHSKTKGNENKFWQMEVNCFF